MTFTMFCPNKEKFNVCKQSIGRINPTSQHHTHEIRVL
jgi:hypothetical protein